MKYDIINFDSKKVGTVELNKNIFSIPIRKDILKDVVDWQLSNRSQGTHKVKQRSEIVGTTAKAFKQKGTGRARRGNLKTNILRGGGVTHGPLVRQHKKKLPKKIRKLGLKTALSVKEKEKKIIIIDKISIDKISTKEISKKLEKLKIKSALIIDSSANKNDKTFKQSILNLNNINLLPVIGMNVYDILKFNNLIISKDALVEVEKKLI
jgi:large subunit ribosomal protein L4